MKRGHGSCNRCSVNCWVPLNPNKTRVCYDVQMMSTLVHPDTCLRYVALLEQLCNSARRDTSFNEPAGQLRVERGVVNGDGLVHTRSKLVDLVHTDAAATVDVVDASGHRRGMYRPLLVYRWLCTDTHAPHGAIHAWADVLTSDLQSFINTPGPVSAEQGAVASTAAWLGLAVTRAGMLLGLDAFVLAGRRVFDRLVQSQRADGSLLHAGRSDNPETQWFHELVIMHAMTSYAVIARDDAALACAMRNASFHQNETQPDHATTQPWGVAAAGCRADTIPLADQLLHSAAVQQPGGIGGVSLMLLDDALYCLTSLSRRDPQRV